MKRDTTKKSSAETIVINSMTALKQHLQLIGCRIAIEDQSGKTSVLEIPCERLRAKVKEQADDLVLAVVPPWDHKLKQYDQFELEYRKKMALAQKQARALIVYSHCPLIAKEKAGLTDPHEIYEFVQGLLAEQVIEALALRIEGSGLRIMREVEGRANFTSTPGSGD
jgi:hypothetical protein